MHYYIRFDPWHHCVLDIRWINLFKFRLYANVFYFWKHAYSVVCMDVIGQITAGEHGSILIRQKAGETIEIGDLLVATDKDAEETYLLQVFNLMYGSQLDSRNIQMIAGMNLEGHTTTSFFERDMRTYLLAELKAVLIIDNKTGKTRVPKTLPPFLSSIKPVSPDDLKFLTVPDNPLFLGHIRSGSKVLEDVPVYIDGLSAFTHHILIPATTGRGKSNLVKVMLWSVIDKRYCGILVLDPHNEYYEAIKAHPSYDTNVKYYTPQGPSMPVGADSLMLNLRLIKPWHFNGIIHFSEAQSDALYVFRNLYQDNWLEELLKHDARYVDSEGDFHGVKRGTLSALQRKIKIALGLSLEGGRVVSRNRVFTTIGAENTIDDIITALESGFKVIVDTSRLNEQSELLIASIIASDVMDRFKRYKAEGELNSKPVISIILEEAPRVLSGGAGEPSIFGAIAREGRKFKVGLTAITQLVSVIPHDVLANMNTKIILGNEMAEERRSIIANASQDLSRDDKMISSLDKGEAIVSSVFTRFAVPVKVPLFEEHRDKYLSRAPKVKETLISYE